MTHSTKYAGLRELIADMEVDEVLRVSCAGSPCPAWFTYCFRSLKITAARHVYGDVVCVVRFK